MRFGILCISFLFIRSEEMNDFVSTLEQVLNTLLKAGKNSDQGFFKRLQQ
jgi:hypothetical protein